MDQSVDMDTTQRFTNDGNARLTAKVKGEVF